MKAVSPATSTALEKEAKDTVVQIDSEGVRRVSAAVLAARQNRDSRTRGGGRAQGRGFGQGLPARRFGSRSPARRDRSRSRGPSRRKSRSRSPARRSPPRRHRSR